jgi:hypothetical protein
MKDQTHGQYAAPGLDRLVRAVITQAGGRSPDTGSVQPRQGQARFARRLRRSLTQLHRASRRLVAGKQASRPLGPDEDTQSWH